MDFARFLLVGRTGLEPVTTETHTANFHSFEIQSVIIPIFFFFPWFCAVFAPIFHGRNDSAYIC